MIPGPNKKFSPPLMFMTNGNTGSFNTGQTETISMVDTYPNCLTKVISNIRLNMTKYEDEIAL